MIYCNLSKYRDYLALTFFGSRIANPECRVPPAQIDMSDIRRLYAVNAFAQTPLHCAASSGSSAVVQDALPWIRMDQEAVVKLAWYQNLIPEYHYLGAPPQVIDTSCF